MNKVKVIAIFLLIKDVIDKKNNYDLFREMYINNKQVKYSEIQEKYYISDVTWWKDSIEKYFNSLNSVDLDVLLNKILEIINIK